MNNIEEHHIIKRSQAKFLVNCELNKVYLCPTHHRSEYGVHGRNGHNLDNKLKMQMQNTLEIILDKQYYTRQEVKTILGINENSANSLCKTMKQNKGLFARQDFIIATLGGKLAYESEELNERDLEIYRRI